ncbi:hypothetical protein P3G55_27195, partial [Leptospira sp. 96542]|nr:hypothetical protein [Leptospira sp. 96542]
MTAKTAAGKSSAKTPVKASAPTAPKAAVRAKTPLVAKATPAKKAGAKAVTPPTVSAKTQKNIKVGLTGVWTEAQVSFLAYDLNTRYPNFE